MTNAIRKSLVLFRLLTAGTPILAFAYGSGGSWISRCPKSAMATATGRPSKRFLTSLKLAAKPQPMSTPSNPRLRIAIVGAGGVGGWLAARLGSAPSVEGVDLVLLARGRHGEAVRRDGLRLLVGRGAGAAVSASAPAGSDADAMGGTVHVPASRFEVYSSAAEALDNRASPVDYALLAVKSWQVEQSAREVSRLLRNSTAAASGGGNSGSGAGDSSSCVVTLQNGVEAPFDALRGAGSPSAVVGGSVRLVGFLGGEPGSVRVEPPPSPADIVLGEVFGPDSSSVEGCGETAATAIDPDSPRVDRLCQILSSTDGINCRFAAPTMWHEIWDKAAFLCSVGPIAALCRCSMDRLVATPETREMTREAVLEIGRCAEAAGYLGAGRTPESTAEAVLEKLGGVPPGYTPSTLRDVVTGRPSEVMQLTGGIVRAGERLGVPTPTHRMVLAALMPQEMRARGLAGASYELLGVPGGVPHVPSSSPMQSSVVSGSDMGARGER